MMLTADRASAIRWAIRAVLGLGLAFGWELGDEQLTAIYLAVDAGLQAYSKFFGSGEDVLVEGDD